MKRIGYKGISLLVVFLLIVPSFAQDEGMASKLAGYTAGLNLGYPVVTGEYYSGGSGPIFGVVANTPYGFAIGPFNMGLGAGFEAAMFKDYTEVGFYGSINTTIYVTPYGPISYYGGAGYYSGLGLIGGIYMDYMVPDMPLVIKPYMRMTLNTAAEDDDGNTAPSYFLNIGVMALYDISTLF